MIDQKELIIKLNRVILIEGFQKLSMSKLAAAVNVSRATLYLYFKNKDEIVQAVVARHLRFITERPIPEKFVPESFMTVWINSLLLMGATTETFNADLQHADPELAHHVRQADQGYFNQLLVYLEKAQQAKVILSTYTPDFIVFQAQTMISGILQEVLTHRVTLDQAEQYLEENMELAQHGLLTEGALEHLNRETINPLKAKILSEFRATYALVL